MIRWSEKECCICHEEKGEGYDEAILEFKPTNKTGEMMGWSDATAPLLSCSTPENFSSHLACWEVSFHVLLRVSGSITLCNLDKARGKDSTQLCTWANTHRRACCRYVHCDAGMLLFKRTSTLALVLPLATTHALTAHTHTHTL